MDGRTAVRTTVRTPAAVSERNGQEVGVIVAIGLASIVVIVFGTGHKGFDVKGYAVGRRVGAGSFVGRTLGRQSTGDVLGRIG